MKGQNERPNRQAKQASKQANNKYKQPRPETQQARKSSINQIKSLKRKNKKNVDITPYINAQEVQKPTSKQTNKQKRNKNKTRTKTNIHELNE